MTMRKISASHIVACALVTSLAFSPPIYAHHSFAAEFDATAPVELKGKITKIEWVNPHVFIHINVEGKDNKSQRWAVEVGSPNTLIRAGLTRDSVKVGTVVLVKGYQAKDHSCKPECQANGRSVTLPDGQKLFVGSPGTGAPDDGAEPKK